MTCNLIWYFDFISQQHMQSANYSYKVYILRTYMIPIYVLLYYYLFIIYHYLSTTVENKYYYIPLQC